MTARAPLRAHKRLSPAPLDPYLTLSHTPPLLLCGPHPQPRTSPLIPPTALSITAPPPHLCSEGPCSPDTLPDHFSQPCTHTCSLLCALSPLLCCPVLPHFPGPPLPGEAPPPPSLPQAFHSWTVSLYIWFKVAPPETLPSGHPGLGFGGLGPLWGLLAPGHPGLSAKNSEYPALPWIWHICWEGGGRGICPQPAHSQVLANLPSPLGLPERDIGPGASGREMGEVLA